MTGDMFATHHVDVHAPGAAQELTARLTDQGLVTFDGVTDPAGLFTLANSVCEPVMHRDSDPEGVTHITDTAGDAAPKPGYRAFASAALFPHTDGTAQPHPPALLWLVCAQPAEAGGASILVDAAEVWRTLAARQPVALAALSTPRLVSFGADPAHTASVFEPAAAHGRLRVRFRNDELVHPTSTAEAVWPTLLEVVAAHRHELQLAAGDAVD
jgi:alpha-ketoglutarate-dependent taurine dioxygenase